MKSVISHPTYGTIIYGESFWTGKKELTVNGKYLVAKSKTIFADCDGDEDIEYQVVGNYAAGVVVKIGGESIQIVPKTLGYEYFIYFIPFILVLIWGNSPQLCQIVPVIGGLIGGAISGAVSFLALIKGKESPNVVRKIIISIIALVVSFAICAGIGILIVG